VIVTWMLALATVGLLTSIAVACRRAHLEAKEGLCDCLQSPDERRLSAVATSPSPALFVLPGEGGRGGGDNQPEGEPDESRRYLRLVGA
jgi:hypothetical protein